MQSYQFPFLAGLGVDPSLFTWSDTSKIDESTGSLLESSVEGITTSGSFESSCISLYFLE